MYALLVDVHWTWESEGECGMFYLGMMRPVCLRYSCCSLVVRGLGVSFYPKPSLQRVLYFGRDYNPRCVGSGLATGWNLPQVQYYG